MIDSFGLVQLNRESSNQSGNILDLAITNCPLLSDVEKCIVDFQSDHAVLQFQIKAKAKKVKSTKQWVYDFKRTNVGGFIKQLSSVDLQTIVQLAPDMDAAWSEWLSHINKVIYGIRRSLIVIVSITEVKQRRARCIIRWVTAWDCQVLYTLVWLREPRKSYGSSD